MILKLLTLGATTLLGVALSAAMPPEPPHEPPPPKAKQKEGKGPGDLKKAYDLLRRIRSDGRSAGRSEGRLRDWTDRATRIYRDALRSAEAGDGRVAHEYGLAAHDLARAVDHARNAASFDLDDDLPPPPAAGGPEEEEERTRRDLRHAYDRINERRDEAGGDDVRYYLDASRDLYNAARRDALARRSERAGELARAAEALTHVPEHLARAAEPGGPPEPKEKKEKRDRPEPKEKPAPKEKRDRPDRDEPVPPPID